MIGAILYDGQTAHKQAVRLEPTSDCLRLEHSDGTAELINPALLTRLGHRSGSLRIGRTDRKGWTLLVPGTFEPQLRQLIGSEEKYGRWIDRVGLVPALTICGVVAGLLVLGGYRAPAAIAPLVPTSWERNLGDAIVGDFGDNRCRDAEGQRALQALVERLAPGSTAGPNGIRVAALDVDFFNAAALPGGHIVVFKPAITEIEDTDELAGIIAHEIAHIRRRHVTEALIRELGISALIRLFAGDVGANAEQLVALNYSRADETEADEDAIRMLRQAGISPLPTARLFEQLAEAEGEDSDFTAEFLQSHPLGQERSERFAASEQKGIKYRPSLAPDQIVALKKICGAA